MLEESDYPDAQRTRERFIAMNKGRRRDSPDKCVDLRSPLDRKHLTVASHRRRHRNLREVRASNRVQSRAAPFRQTARTTLSYRGVELLIFAKLGERKSS